jgi:hypothetical protein
MLMLLVTPPRLNVPKKVTSESHPTLRSRVKAQSIIKLEELSLSVITGVEKPSLEPVVAAVMAAVAAAIAAAVARLLVALSTISPCSFK